MAKKIKLKKKDEEVELALDEKASTKAKKIYKGRDSKGRSIKHIELDMQPKDKEAK